MPTRSPRSSAHSASGAEVATPTRPLVVSPIRLVPASIFSIHQLTAAYNQTRVDYLVPMPMNAARLAEYIDVYDVDMERSLVALDGEEMLGLAMLGARSGRTWITRLGVLPVRRRAGTGEALMRGLLAESQQMGIDFTILEVIKNNTPAHQLFLKLGFYEVRELLILRRPPHPPRQVPAADVRWLDRADVVERVRALPIAPAWTHEAESFANASSIMGLRLTLDDGSCGWLAFQSQRFILTRLILRTERGDPVRVGRALLTHLYRQHPDIDTHAENIPVDDPHIPALFEAGFVESFRRIEMHRQA